MCGIYAVASTKGCVKTLINGLNTLRYRGYDSCGSSILSGCIKTYKTLNEPNELSNQIKQPANYGIAHTRWATHGDVSLKNAHPHISKNQIAIVHNGIITNYVEIKKDLQKAGYQFNSETDSECIAHLLDSLLKAMPIDQALNTLNQRLKGRYAIAGLIKDNQEVFAMRSDMPLYIGKGKGTHILSSDLYALDQCVSFAHIPNHQPIRVSAHKLSTQLIVDSIPDLTKQPRHADDHTLREIFEQPKL